MEFKTKMLKFAGPDLSHLEPRRGDPLSYPDTKLILLKILGKVHTREELANLTSAAFASYKKKVGDLMENFSKKMVNETDPKRAKMARAGYMALLGYWNNHLFRQPTPR
jgi:hypothetical protein